MRHLLVVSLLVISATLQSSAQSSRTLMTSREAESPKRLGLDDNGSAQQSRLVSAFGRVPLRFEVNRGQTDAQVQFVSHGPGYTLFLTTDHAVISLAKSRHTSTDARKITSNGPPAVVSLQLLGISRRSVIEPEGELAGKSNYFIGNDPNLWRTDIPSYAKVHYRDIYPGIDVLYYGNQRQLEHDFVLAPGANPEVITFAVRGGAERFRLEPTGDLLIDVDGGELRLLKPVIYQQVDGRRQDIAGHYVLKGKNEVGFAVSKYDRTRTLIIDPVLSYATYLGGSDLDQAYGIAVDSSGSAYITGQTSSINFPTNNALQTSGALFVTKLTADGSGLAYSTYFGGTGVDQAWAISVDNTGSAFITGQTTSTDFPVSHAYQGSLQGSSDAFIARFTPSGSSLVYSSYLGGTADDYGRAIAADNSGNAYVTGYTGSTNFPTKSAYRATKLGTYDAFVTKLAWNGTTLSLVYSTYFGGSGNDYGRGIAIDSSGSAYITGFTTSTNLPTLHPIQSAFGGANDAFVTKFAWSGTTLSLVYSTYLGGSGNDYGFGIAVDSAGSAYITGQTASTNYPNKNAIRSSLSGASDAFVTKLGWNGTTLSNVYSTYLGGTGAEQANGIAVDASGSAYVTGQTSSTDFPTKSAIQNVSGGTSDAFVSRLTADGTALLFSSYLGGSGVDYGSAIAVDSTVNANAYIAGYTASNNLATLNAFQNSYGGGTDDAFVAKIVSITSTTTTVSADVNPQPAGSSVTFTAYVAPVSGSPTPTGTITFYDGATQLTQVTLDGTGHASYATSTLSAGPHTIKGSYSGDASSLASNGTMLEKIVGPPTSITVMSGSGQSTTYGAAFPNPLVVQVTDSNSYPVPSASVTFSGSGLSFSSGGVAITGSNGQASIIATAQAVGSLTATAKVNGVATTANFSLSATQATPTINWPTPAGITYGTALSATQLNATASVPGTFAYTPGSGTVLGSGAQTLSVTFTPTDTTNYTAATASISLTIAKATLTVTANSFSRTYGAANPTFTAAYAGFVNGESQTVLTGSPTLTTTATSSSPVGAYAITTAHGSLSAANYTFTFVNGSLTITQASLTITADNLSRVYGAANPVFTYTIAGFVNGETQTVLTGSPSLTTAAIPGSPIGPYTITAAQGSLTAANYAFLFVNGTLTVTPAPVTVTANSLSRSYGSANPTLTCTITGFVNGDTQSVITGSPSLSTTATTGSPAGQYAITATLGTLAAANYSFAFASGNLTVNQATLTVAADNLSRTYGLVNPPLTYTVTGLVNGDTQSVLSGSPSLTTSAGVASAVGTYPIVLMRGTLTSANYSFSVVNGSMTITQAVPTIAWGTPAVIAYGTPLSIAQLNATASVPGTFGYTPAIGSVLGPGSQTLSVIFTPSDALDYTTSGASVTLQVTQATPVINWQNPRIISYGTPLSPTQLNATANVPGTFVYNPPAGTILTIGSQTLSVTFTPTDTTDYTTATATVTQVVNPDAPPVLFYSDLDSGPATGGEGGTDGAFVCVYGENFGSSQGSSTMTIGGTAAAQYKLWNDPGPPYEGGNNIAKACVQISHLTPAGTQSIMLTGPNGASNSLPFTVRPGNIWWVAPSGNDATGNGSQVQPWATITQCKNQMMPGDICVVEDGITVSTMENYEAALWLNSSGTAGNPKAIVAYPGSHVSIAATVASGQWASTGQLQGINNYNGGNSTCGSAGCSYWTIAGFTQINGSNGSVALLGGSNFRLVDNDIVCQGAYCDGSSGGLAAAASQLSVYGNRFHDIGCHDDMNYQTSAHPCVWQAASSSISTTGVSFNLSSANTGLTEGDVIQAAGQLRRIISCGTSCMSGLTAGILDAPFASDLPVETPYEYRDFVPSKLWHNAYFGNNSNSVQFAWNNVDGSVGKACRGVLFNATMLDSTTGFSLYDLHVHDNFIHDTVCDGINFGSVDPSRGTVEAYNNVIYNAGTGNGSIFNGGDPVGGVAHYSCIYSPGYVNNGTPGSGSILVYNNTLYNCGSRAILGNSGTLTGALGLVTGATPNLYMVASNNIMYAPDPQEIYVQNVSNRLCTSVAPYCSSTSTNNVFFGSSGTAPAYLTGNLAQNPNFAAAPSDFHMYVSNPAASSGSALASTIDADGVTRDTTHPTPGAYEYLTAIPANPKTPAASITAIVSSANPQNYDVRLPFVISVSPSSRGSAVPSGQVSIYDGTAELTALTLDGSGTASFAMWLLAPGTHYITAYYRGDANFAGSQGSIVQNINGPALILSPTSLALSAALNMAATQTMTLSNPGNGPLTITSIAFAGSTEFSITNNNCLLSTPATLAGGGACTFDLNFQPTLATSVVRKGTLAVKVAAPAVSQVLLVTGSVVTPTASLLPSSAAFEQQVVLASSAVQTFTLSNTSAQAAVKINAVVVPLNWIQVAGPNQCVAAMSLPAAGSCSLFVSFRPVSAGAKTGQLQVLLAAPGVSQGVTLTGTGVAAITVSPTLLNFGLTTRGTNKTMTLVLTNPANNPALTGISVAFTGNTHFSQATTATCGTSLAGASTATTCTIDVLYAPDTTEVKAALDKGTLTITGSLNGTPQSKALTLYGTAY